MPQKNILRTNCLDCLDRTNIVQQSIGGFMLELQLDALGLPSKYYERFSKVFRLIWHNNGNMISNYYTGTDALNSELALTGRRTARSIVNDGIKSVTRIYKNNVKDAKVQELIDLILTTPHPSYSAPNRPLLLKIRLCIATYNVNGLACPASISLGPWYLLHSAMCNLPQLLAYDNYRLTDYVVDDPPDIYAIGFQEIVNIDVGRFLKQYSLGVQAEVDSRFLSYSWNTHNMTLFVLALDTLGTSYKLLTRQQLVGVCLYLFVADSLLCDVHDVMVETTKVGLHGFAGNKGCVAVSFQVKDTAICCASAHLTAGQLNVYDRLRDLQDINRLTLFKGKGILSHNYVFWFGDLNFRIDLPADFIRKKIKENCLQPLLKKDQLLMLCSPRGALSYFHEGSIHFNPTYKFNLNSDVYDTSEKARAPAWTDRILFFVNKQAVYGNVTQYYYNSCNLRISDHRPVSAVFDITVLEIVNSLFLREFLSNFAYLAYRQDNDLRQEIIKNFSSSSSGHLCDIPSP
ncbi:hypothetical protein Zmor_012366 [Zophobas morio]|uniref:phosphoinositide 5-phosphatase n=1 Tax=Zophobas morio TaxID=2755281 RepID=A0AA38HFW2_9CUCU|nr:hypothetical protein Zmor_012366 [Zophobas morio]